MLIDEIFVIASLIVVVTLTVRWIKRRNVPAYDTVWWEFSGVLAGGYLVSYNWEQGDWLSVGIIGFWTFFRLLGFLKSLEVDEKEKLTGISG